MGEPLHLILTDTEHTHRVARTLAHHLQAGDLLVLTGELGAGKTTFTRALGEGLGVRGGIISPTFVLSRVHPNLVDGPRPGGPDLVHVDAYRLTGTEEVDDLDLEYSMERSVTVIEWGAGKVEHLSESRLEIELVRLSGAEYTAETGGDFDWEHNDEPADTSEPRQLCIRAVGPRWKGKPWEHLTKALD